jgi:hypothetical protein
MIAFLLLTVKSNFIIAPPRKRACNTMPLKSTFCRITFNIHAFFAATTEDFASNVSLWGKLFYVVISEFSCSKYLSFHIYHSNSAFGSALSDYSVRNMNATSEIMSSNCMYIKLLQLCKRWWARQVFKPTPLFTSTKSSSF